MVRRWPLAMLVLGVVLSLPYMSQASGSYPGRPVRPPASGIDHDRYHLGKDVFTGRASLSEGAGASMDQQSRLTDLQGRLPKSAQDDADLPGLAGKLSAEQLDALEYYLSVRYKIGAGR